MRAPDGGVLHILSLADNAPPGTGEGAIATRYRAVLAEERDRLEAVLAEEFRASSAEAQLRIGG